MRHLSPASSELYEEFLLLHALPPKLIARWRSRNIEIHCATVRSDLRAETVFLVQLLLVDPHQTFVVIKTKEVKQVRLKARLIELRYTPGEPPLFVLNRYGSSIKQETFIEPFVPREFRNIVEKEIRKMLYAVV